jgi:hypothetical protein
VPLANGPRHAKMGMRTHARYHYVSVIEGLWCPIPSTPTSPMTSATGRLKRRTHSTRSAATIAAIKWSGSFLSKDNPPRVQSQELENRPSEGAIDAPI